VVINADDYYGPESFHKMASFLRERNPQDRQFGLSGYPIENTLSAHGTVSRAICEIAADGSLIGIVERPRIQRSLNGEPAFESLGEWVKIPTGTVVSMNFWGLTPAFFTELEPYLHQFFKQPAEELVKSELYLPAVINELVKTGRVKVSVFQSASKWFGVTNPEDCLSVQADLRYLHDNGIYPTPIWKDGR
jgi:hypothetical protein